MEESKQVLNLYLNKFLSGYRDVVNTRYFYQFQSSPEAFPLFEDANYKISIVLLNEEFFEYPKVVIISNNSIMESFYDYRSQELHALSEKYTSYIYDPEAYVRDHLNIVNTDENVMYISTYHGEFPINKPLDYKLDDYYRAGKHFAENHFRKFNNVSKERMTDKSHEEVQPFNHLDLNSMKKVVNDKTFTYQINQGLQAYKRELYLPAAATFAVAIESFLIKLKRANNIKHKDSDPTMYDKLLESLKERKKINYRTKRRIEVAYNMRNIINHSQVGAVAKADCDFLLNTLKDIIDANEKVLTDYNKLIDDIK
ncbi:MULTISPECIES: hypothetical protein [Staphylococcus]|uniref:hypothetical protein n=1 Tax=Staphylococcus TaxID=1279 RepID=UPI000EEC6976|nr:MULTISPECIES: hypothetical protein [Staphylococcus]MCI2788490.1 hypothetical protein [Staphylococcus warneri]HBY82120.1 hypothetical protein [Staphylococcus sp.]